MKKLNFIDLFSGCGGFSKGLELAGHNCLLGVDFEKDAIETFKHNHNNAEVFLGDISNLSKSHLLELLKGQKVDVVIGGPPCQGFSTVGRGDVDDKRNKLFLEFVRIVEILKPDVVVFENVTGIVAKKNKDTLSAVFKSFEKLGYTMDARVLSSEEYGVPETRRRAILIGAKNGIEPIFPEITHGDRGKFKLNTVGDAFECLNDDEGNFHNHDPKMAQIKKDLDRKRLKHIPEGKGIRYKRDEDAYLPKRLKYDVIWEGLAENRFRQTKLQRLDRKLPSPTILTSRTSYYHPIEPRYLTPREAAACQSFPNDFIFFGSQTSQFRQIGNAVPPLLAYAIGLTLMKMFNRKSKGKVTKKQNVDITKYAFHYHNKTVA